jgi:hypothetical protein
LFAAKAKLSADSFDSVNTDLNAMVCKVSLQTFRAVCPSISFMSRFYFDLKPGFLHISR